MSPHRASRARGGAFAAVRLCAWFLCVALGAGCTASNTNIPVSRREARAAVHVVQAGETLTRIAWQHRVEADELAAWNGIVDPNTLRVGQRLRLVPPRGYVAAAPAPVPQPTARTPPSPPRSTPQTQPQRSRQPTPTRATTPRPTPRAAAPSPARQGASAAAAPRWSWPTDGRIATSFGSADGIESGIGIAGREGQPVRAAAAGRVVYAGGGLMGYGQLVIIKHDETFLSAYGYNSELLVTQGQDVASGATIALMGQGPGRQPRLHFEIRRNGTPVDPLLFVTAPR
jgi:lipoprotein NlpD